LAVAGAAPERNEAEVIDQGRPCLIVGNGADVVEAVRAAELGGPGRADKMQQGRFLDAHSVPRDSFERAPSMGRVSSDRGAADPLDHRRPPVLPARTRSPLSHSLTTPSNAPGRSSMGAWPHVGRYPSRDPGMPAC